MYIFVSILNLTSSFLLWVVFKEFGARIQATTFIIIIIIIIVMVLSDNIILKGEKVLYGVDKFGEK